MRTLAWLAVVAVVAATSPAHAESPALEEKAKARGGWSVLGLSLAALGAGGLGLGLSGLAGGERLDGLINAYLPASAPDASVLRALLDRRDAATAMSVAGFVAGGAMLIAGIICLIVDAPRRPGFALVPTRTGASLVFALEL